MTEDFDADRIAREMAQFDALPPDLRDQVNEGSLEIHIATGLASRRQFLDTPRPADGGLKRTARRR